MLVTAGNVNNFIVLLLNNRIMSKLPSLSRSVTIGGDLTRCVCACVCETEIHMNNIVTRIIRRALSCQLSRFNRFIR